MKAKMLMKHLGNTLSKNAPVIYTGLGIAGFWGAIVLGIKSTPKAIQMLKEAREKKNEKLTMIESVKACGVCYIPAGISALASSALILLGNKQHLRRNAAIATAYSLYKTSYDEYKSKAEGILGDKKSKVYDEMAKDAIVKNPVTRAEVINTGRGTTLCYDSLSGRYFRSDIEKIRQAFNETNREMLADMYKSLNELYYELGLANILIGDDIGWHIDDGCFEPYFSSHLNENEEPCLVINYSIPPSYDYKKMI